MNNQNTDERKPKGWFSRRHATREAHEEAVARYTAHHGREWRKIRATELQNLRAGRTPQKQLTELDHRLGKGVGATKERARLKKQIIEAV